MRIIGPRVNHGSSNHLYLFITVTQFVHFILYNQLYDAFLEKYLTSNAARLPEPCCRQLSAVKKFA